jgi:ABC-type transporter Mla maintaining outer membrane lipid asymmetry ATPase subunit MlaF
MAALFDSMTVAQNVAFPLREHTSKNDEEIREIVPDSILDGAVIELVDLPPAELVQRLHEGKVYLPERAAAAAQTKADVWKSVGK